MDKLVVQCLTTSLVLLAMCTSSHGAKILLAPFPFQSHIRQILNIGKGLHERGHEVYLLTSPSTPDLDKVKVPNIKLIFYEVDEPDLYSTFSEEDMSGALMHSMDISAKQDIRTGIDGVKEMCNNPLKDKKLYSTLKNLKFDLAIVDVFPCARCLLVLMHRLGIPYVNVVTCTEPWLLRNPAIPSVVPFILGENPYTPQMTFWERLDNLWSVVDWFSFTGVLYLEDDYLKEYFYETTPVSLNKLTGRALLWLIDQTPLMDYPNPTMPNEIYVGGLSTKPAKPLPDDLEKFISGNPNGAIVVSFGSMGNSLPLTILDNFIAAFEMVKYNVIMRYPVENDKKVSPHIKLMSWLPQNDLLGHKNVKLFITHCGANGQVESLYHGVPMIGFPMFAEQWYNAIRGTYHGYGLHMDMRSFKAADLAEKILEVIENPSYTENIKRASRIFQDQPMSPNEKALYWIEHVIKHGGDHLHSHALDMEWYEYLMLDILAFVLCVVTLIAGVSVFVVKKMLSLLCGSKNKSKLE